MAISGLVALKNILDLLYENGKHMIDIAGSLTMWFVSLSLADISPKCARHTLLLPLDSGIWFKTTANVFSQTVIQVNLDVCIVPGTQPTLQLIPRQRSLRDILRSRLLHCILDMPAISRGTADSGHQSVSLHRDIDTQPRASWFHQPV